MKQRKSIQSIPEVLASNIKTRRTELGITQSQLAEKLEISNTYIAELETGRKSASLDVIQRLCDVLSMRPYELFLEEGKDNPPSDSRDTIRKLTMEATTALNKAIKTTLEDISTKYLK